MYKKLLPEVNHNGKKLKMPFIIDGDGMPFEPLNAFIREKVFENNQIVASTLDEKVNRIIVFLRFLDKQNRVWRQVTHDRVRQFRDQNGVEEKRDRNSNTINMYLAAIYEFYWWVEKKGFCEGVIGITDTDEDSYEFPLFVYPPRHGEKIDYRIPTFLKTPPQRTRTNITTKDVWEEAYEKALDEGSVYSRRDAALILFILMSGSRQLEARFTRINQFEKDPHPSQKTMTVYTGRTKGSADGRYLNIPVEAYIEIQEFIEEDRPSLVFRRNRDAGFLFCNPKGEPISKSQVWKILGKYGIKSHDGRSNNLTEFFLEKIREGIDEESAMLLAREHAGHSHNDRSAKTLKNHYLQAKALFDAQSAGTYLQQERRKNEAMQAELDLARDRIVQLESELDALKTGRDPTFG